MIDGNCALCHKDRKLCESHFMPKALGDPLRTDDIDPIQVTDEVVMLTRRMLKHPLLCFHCEQSLCTEGETWVLPLLARIDGSFPFLDLIEQQPPLVTGDGVELYGVTANPEIDRQKLINFGLGIFFKAAVHSWRGGETKPWIDLGSHTEELRKYLVGEADFPKNMALVLMVDPEITRHIGIHQPLRGSNPDFMNFHFYVPGIFFHLCLGENIVEQKALCLVSVSEGPVLVKSVFDDVIGLVRESQKKARKGKKVMEVIARADELDELRRKLWEGTE